MDNEITGLLSGRKRLLSIVFDGDEVDQSEKLHSVHDIVEEKLLGVVFVSHLAHCPLLELKYLKHAAQDRRCLRLQRGLYMKLGAAAVGEGASESEKRRKQPLQRMHTD